MSAIHKIDAVFENNFRLLNPVDITPSSSSVWTLPLLDLIPAHVFVFSPSKNTLIWSNLTSKMFYGIEKPVSNKRMLSIGLHRVHPDDLPSFMDFQSDGDFRIKDRITHRFLHVQRSVFSFFIPKEDSVCKVCFEVEIPAGILKNRSTKFSNEIVGKEHAMEKLSVLSQREREVLLELCRGKTNKEIGKSLFISVETVKSHRKSMKNKLKVTSNASLICLAKEAALI